MRTAPAALALAAATAAALVFTAAASAGRDAYTVRMTAEGQAAARAALLTKADLGPGWEGGPRKPQLSSGLSCPHFHPKFADLVIVGAAAVQYHQPGLQMRSDSQVFRTEKMVRTDWRRTAQGPRFLSCLRAVAKRAATSGKSRFVSFRKLRVPVIGTNTIAFRTIFDVRSPSRHDSPRDRHHRLHPGQDRADADDDHGARQRADGGPERARAREDPGQPGSRLTKHGAEPPSAQDLAMGDRCFLDEDTIATSRARSNARRRALRTARVRRVRDRRRRRLQGAHEHRGSDGRTRGDAEAVGRR